ncbi:MAG: choice-of-anchor D domain-containing protein, partial [bacterium]|nr:choice-of-anchor D domain-containing protein [bacterium]
PDDDEFKFTVTGTGLPHAPEINIYQEDTDTHYPDGGDDPYDFEGIIPDGNDAIASGYVDFTIENVGTLPLEITNIDFMSGDFEQFDFETPFSESFFITAGESSIFAIRFDPLENGSQIATVRIESNDTDEVVYTFNIVGIGLDVDINLKQGITQLDNGDGTYNFIDNVNADGDGGIAGSYIPFTIENLGQDDLKISGVIMNSGDTSDFDIDISSMLTTVSGGGSTTFSVRFDPLTVGSRGAAVEISSNDGNDKKYEFQAAILNLTPDSNL